MLCWSHVGEFAMWQSEDWCSRTIHSKCFRFCVVHEIHSTVQLLYSLGIRLKGGRADFEKKITKKREKTST